MQNIYIIVLLFLVGCTSFNGRYQYNRYYSFTSSQMIPQEGEIIITKDYIILDNKLYLKVNKPCFRYICTWESGGLHFSLEGKLFSVSTKDNVRLRTYFIHNRFDEFYIIKNDRRGR